MAASKKIAAVAAKGNVAWKFIPVAILAFRVLWEAIALIFGIFTSPADQNQME